MARKRIITEWFVGFHIVIVFIAPNLKQAKTGMITSKCMSVCKFEGLCLNAIHTHFQLLSRVIDYPCHRMPTTAEHYNVVLPEFTFFVKRFEINKFLISDIGHNMDIIMSFSVAAKISHCTFFPNFVCICL